MIAKLGLSLGKVVPVMLGVLLAGWVMYQFRDVDIINQARNGFDT